MIAEFLDLSKRFSWQQQAWPECVGVAEWYPSVCNLELANRLVRSSERDVLAFTLQVPSLYLLISSSLYLQYQQVLSALLGYSINTPSNV